MKQSGNIFWCTPDEIHIEEGKVSGSTVVELMKKNKDTKSVERQIEKQKLKL